ncbi:hypothetical protein GIB67_031125 [Kingdonia uniflora]|uniref:Protein kinase domain-containing protein n=1 Tax=Kingdonia uniflora TaxID=39325 RepID=A0A7J7ME73_9MAGN|nr:hypothetical protein GIB67_031125 [Kingdonia uniflora]
MISIPQKKKTLHSILVGNLTNLSIIPPSTSTSTSSPEDFDFSEVFGPLTSQHPTSLSQDHPDTIHSRSHSFVGPSPRITTPNSHPFGGTIFDVVENGSQCSSDEEEEEEEEEEEKEEEKVKEEEDVEEKWKMGPMDFDILRVIGQGAFGKVFQVRKKENCNEGDDGVFAMKVMRKDTIIKKNHIDYMRAERDILTKVVHPFIVQLRYSFQLAGCQLQIGHEQSLSG